MIVCYTSGLVDVKKTTNMLTCRFINATILYVSIGFIYRCILGSYIIEVIVQGLIRENTKRGKMKKKRIAKKILIKKILIKSIVIAGCLILAAIGSFIFGLYQAGWLHGPGCLLNSMSLDRNSGWFLLDLKDGEVMYLTEADGFGDSRQGIVVRDQNGRVMFRGMYLPDEPAIRGVLYKEEVMNSPKEMRQYLCHNCVRRFRKKGYAYCDIALGNIEHGTIYLIRDTGFHSDCYGMIVNISVN